MTKINVHKECTKAGWRICLQLIRDFYSLGHGNAHKLYSSYECGGLFLSTV